MQSPMGGRDFISSLDEDIIDSTTVSGDLTNAVK